MQIRCHPLSNFQTQIPPLWWAGWWALRCCFASCRFLTNPTHSSGVVFLEPVKLKIGLNVLSAEEKKVAVWAPLLSHCSFWQQVYFTHGKRFIKGLMPPSRKVSSVTFFGADSLILRKKLYLLFLHLTSFRCLWHLFPPRAVVTAIPVGHWKSNIANLEFVCTNHTVYNQSLWSSWWWFLEWEVFCVHLG